MDDYRTLLLDAYKGELLGAALFAAFARHESGERAAKLRTLAQIEADTAAHLYVLVHSAGIDLSVDDRAAVEADGAQLGNSGIDWDTFIRGLHDELPGYLANFVRARTLAPEPNHPALVALIVHEQATNAFAELELAGRPDCSPAVLQWYLDSVA